MGLDLYSGSIARWSVGDWETAAAQASREMGMSHRTVRVNPLPTDTPQYRQTVRDGWAGWREWLIPQLGGAGPDWTDTDSTPFVTRQCPYDCYFALISWAGRLVHPAPPPPWPIPNDYDDRSVAAALEGGDALQQDLRCAWWFPGAFTGVFQAPTPFSDEPIWIGSIASLIEKLRVANDASWQMSDAEIRKWADGGPPGLDDVVYEPTVKRSFFGLIKTKDLKPVPQSPPADGLTGYERAARYALAALLQTALEAETNNTPLLLDT